MTDQPKTIADLEKEIDGLVSAYQLMLNSDIAKATDRDGRFMGILAQLQAIEATNPRSHAVLVDLLHTTLFWLAEAKDSLEQPEGNRRLGGQSWQN